MSSPIIHWAGRTYRVTIVASRRAGAMVGGGVALLTLTTYTAWGQTGPMAPSGTLVLNPSLVALLTSGAAGFIAYGAMRVRLERVEKDIAEKAGRKEVEHAAQIAAMATEHVKQELSTQFGALRAELRGFRSDLREAREADAGHRRFRDPDEEDT